MLKPIVLPSKVVKRLIFYIHVKSYHAVLQILLNLLREKYWILNGRKTIKLVIATCIVCKRLNSKRASLTIASLSENQVKDSHVFQIVGTDCRLVFYISRTIRKVRFPFSPLQYNRELYILD